MANSKLIGKKWAIPDMYLKILKEKLSNYNGDKHVQGYTRLQNLVNSGEISYENLKNVKHILDSNVKNETIYNLNGGTDFHRWVNDQLGSARKSIENIKKVQKDSGITNAYKKPHTKDSTNKGKIRNPKLHKSTSSDDILNHNVNYESVQKSKIKILLSESQYNRIFLKENLDQNEIQNLHNLVKSGDSENIELAFQIAQSNNYDLETWLQQEYGELIDFLIKYDEQLKKLENVKEKIKYILNIESLNLNGKSLESLPKSIGKLINLTSLLLSNNNLSSLPKEFENLVNLEILSLYGNNFSQLPKSVEKLINLKEIDLGKNNISMETLFNIFANKKIKKVLPYTRILYNLH